jgi:hypothetical protein
MFRWNDTRVWVSDENGMRWYFSERDPGGPSRLECYRRLLAEPTDLTRRGHRASCDFSEYVAPFRRMAVLLGLAKRSWQASR